MKNRKLIDYSEGKGNEGIKRRIRRKKKQANAEWSNERNKNKKK